MKSDEWHDPVQGLAGHTVVLIRRVYFFLLSSNFWNKETIDIVKNSTSSFFIDFDSSLQSFKKEKMNVCVWPSRRLNVEQNQQKLDIWNPLTNIPSFFHLPLKLTVVWIRKIKFYFLKMALTILIKFSGLPLYRAGSKVH